MLSTSRTAIDSLARDIACLPACREFQNFRGVSAVWMKLNADTNPGDVLDRELLAAMDGMLESFLCR
jgi:hypothetical protein